MVSVQLQVIKDPQDQDRIFTLKILQAGEDLQKILYDVEDLKLFAETVSYRAIFLVCTTEVVTNTNDRLADMLLDSRKLSDA